MLQALITFSLRHRLVVIAGSLLMAAAGLWAFRHLSFDAFPDTTPVQVQVNTTAPALGPLEVERQLTFPIEQSLGGLEGLLEVRSLSKFGLSQVTAVFEDGADIYRARQLVTERLATARLPPGVERPELGPVATGLGEVFHYLVTSDEHSLAELRTLHDWEIAPQLRAVTGVAEVNAWGGDERQVHVLLDPRDLQQRDLTLADVVSAIERTNANVGGGAIDAAGETRLVQGIGLLETPQDVADITLTTREGVPLRLGDLGRVVEGRELRRGAVTADGRGEVVLGLGFMLMGHSGDDVTRRLAARLDEVRRTLPAGVTVEPVYQRTDLVDRVLKTVRDNLLEGAALVVAVLFVFMGDLRAGLIVASAIPLSMLFAFDLMSRAGLTGTLMSLGAIDFGLVVDSSVIMVENASHRLSEAPPGRSRLDVVRDAALEVRRPTLFGELIIMVVYLPILLLEGVEGKLFRPMALTVIFALLGSMILSVTLMPALASLLLPNKPPRRTGPGLVMRGLLALYRPLLRAALRYRVALLAGVVAALAGGVHLASRLGAEFVPRLDEGAIAINTVRLAGVSLDESVRYGTQIERALLERFPDEIDRLWTRTGTAEVATDPMGLEVSDVFVTLTPRETWKAARTQDELVGHMQALVSTLPGMRAVFSQPIEMRLNEMVAGVRADLGVKVFGPDYEVLKKKAREVEAVLNTLPGAVDVTTETVTGQPVLEIRVDHQAAARHGVPPSDILATIEAIGGTEVATLYEGQRTFPIAVRLEEHLRTDDEALGRVLVTTPAGAQVPLSALTTLETVEQPGTVQREWARRRVIVQANVRGRDLAGFVAEARAALHQQVALAPGYDLQFGGQFAHYESARQRLTIVVPLALALIFLLLYLTYGRVLDALRVFTGVPTALLGGVVALWLRDMPFSISAGVGFVALTGVSVLGDMVLASTIRQRLDQGLPLREAILGGAERRLRPVLMTSLVAGLGFIPMALSVGPGAEVQRPLATVVIGGVLSSTCLTLLVLPALYSFVGLGRRPAPAASPDEAATEAA